MKKQSVILLILVSFTILSSCYVLDDSNNWRLYCPDFPSVEEAEKVLDDHKELLDQMEDELLTYGAVVVECSHGAFIDIHYPGLSVKERLLEILDEAGAREEGDGMFFGIPFKFTNL